MSATESRRCHHLRRASLSRAATAIQVHVQHARVLLQHLTPTGVQQVANFVAQVAARVDESALGGGQSRVPHMDKNRPEICQPPTQSIGFQVA